MRYTTSSHSHRHQHCMLWSKVAYIAVPILLLALIICTSFTNRHTLSSIFTRHKASQEKQFNGVVKSKEPRITSPPSGYAVPILCYHDFRDDGEHMRWVTPPKRFEAHLQMLNALGFKFLTMSEAVEIMRGRWDKPIPKRPVVITIDDGFRSAYKIAYPLLSKHGAKATLFIYTNAVGRFGLSWGQLKEMVQSGRIEVASHTVTHTNPNSLKKRLSPDDYRERLVYEFIASKRLLEHKLGVKVNGLAYTCGIVDSVAMEIARAAGYKWAVTIAPKPFTPHTNPYRIPRYGVSNSTTVLVLRKWLTSKTFAFAQLSHPMNCKVSH